MSDTVDVRFLVSQVRALQRQLAILQAGQQQLPTLDQFQAGLSVIDGQFAELGTMIATKVMAAIGEYLTAIEQRLGAIEAKLSSGAA
jgi:type IV secretory pathway VirB6-like protein